MLDVNKFSEVVDLDFDYDDMTPEEIYKEKKYIVMREVNKNFNKEHKTLKNIINIIYIILISPLLLLTLILELLGVLGDKLDNFTVDFRRFIFDKVGIRKFKKKYGIK